LRVPGDSILAIGELALVFRLTKPSPGPCREPLSFPRYYPDVWGRLATGCRLSTGPTLRRKKREETLPAAQPVMGD
jgi:hypothetical protein